jgi:hypothetical protein
MPDRNLNASLAEEIKGALVIVLTIIFNRFVQKRYRRWGATIEEVSRTLPGDDLVPNPKAESTRAITIYATISDVWLWLVQLGYGRGGLYSFERLEHLFGCDMHNVNHIEAGLQNLAEGDSVRLDPRIPLPYTVAAIEPRRSIVLTVKPNSIASKPSHLSQESERPQEIHTWTFHLDRIGEQTTRLVIRSRHDYAPTRGNSVMWRGIVDPIQYVMEREMLRGIKRRAEDIE